MKPISAALETALYEMTHNEDDAGFLRHHPGNGSSIIRLSSWRIQHHPTVKKMDLEQAKLVEDGLISTYHQAQALCESPIERDMLAALMTANWDQCAIPVVPVIAASSTSIPDHPIVIVPQFQFGRYRLDFAILCRGMKPASIIALECDGAEFHDTEQDRTRDAYLRAFGVHVFRATGSAIHRAPEEISNLIVNLAQDRI